MPKFETAHRIEQGGTIEYDTDRLAGQGGMKRVFFTRDGCEVVAFYLTPIQDRSDPRVRRLSDVIGRFNPTRDGENLCDHWRRVFCWPTALVHHPQRGLGFVAPAYPKNFFFTEGKRKGTEKSGQWFNNIDSGSQRSFRHVHIEPSERGDLRSLVCSLLELCRAVNRMHLAGLAHSDLSENNVLFDPCRGTGHGGRCRFAGGHRSIPRGSTWNSYVHRPGGPADPLASTCASKQETPLCRNRQARTRGDHLPNSS